MSNYDIFAIEPRERGGERNFYPVPRGVSGTPLQELPLPKTTVTDLSDTFHKELMKRLTPYLLPEDKISFVCSTNYFNFYPLDTIYRATDFVSRSNSAAVSFNEILSVADQGIIQQEGFLSAVIDCHLKTILSKVGAKRPGYVEISFAFPDLINPTLYGEKSLYAFLNFEARYARLETEMSFCVTNITKKDN